MSKKNRKRSPEIPRVGNAPEVPNYVIPTTDLESREAAEGRGNPAEGQDCRQDCRE